MVSISKNKPHRANLRPILTPFTKPHTHHSQHYWLTLSSLHSLQTNFDQPVRLGTRGVGFSKGGQNWPQICSMRLSFRDIEYLRWIFALHF